ncbi:hypothetical protein D5F01_LYC12555 [Larimichthys crocea]|uniref:Ig-like domain-containing protein n=1 Tax=Larimichthys crocea TaxID=215358 RepID=A0A6G0IB75_LARCR|nr:hypothetical protein D5F01_LYC12555 [Larimichthys crocea]
MAHFCLQCLLLILLTVISECGGASPEIASAARGENVVLPCFNSTVMDQKSCYRVKLFVTDDKQVLFARPKSPKFPDDKRIKWQADKNGKMLLYLTKLQESDVRSYTCEICKGWDCAHVKTISVKIKECSTLAAPVKAAPNASINLNCPVDIKPGEQGPSKISWVMRKGDKSVDVNSEMVKINGTLAIQSVKKRDSSWYRCNYTLGQTQRCFDMNLLVQDEVNHSVVATTIRAPTTNVIISLTGKNSSIVAVVSVIFVIAIIAALIGLLIYCRRNTRRNPVQTQRHTTESFDGYEIVALAVSEDTANQRVNSLYHQSRDSSLCTFQY